MGARAIIAGMSEQLISLLEHAQNYDQVEFTADLCIKCNICTSACPVAPVTELFPGPKTVGPQAQRFRWNEPRGSESPDKSVDYCSGCGICTMVCPHGVKIMEMNTHARERLYDGHIPFRNRALGRSELMGKLGHKFAPLVNFGAQDSPRPRDHREGGRCASRCAAAGLPVPVLP